MAGLPCPLSLSLRDVEEVGHCPLVPRARAQHTQTPLNLRGFFELDDVDVDVLVWRLFRKTVLLLLFFLEIAAQTTKHVLKTFLEALQLN